MALPSCSVCLTTSSSDSSPEISNSSRLANSSDSSRGGRKLALFISSPSTWRAGRNAALPISSKGSSTRRKLVLPSSTSSTCVRRESDQEMRSPVSSLLPVWSSQRHGSLRRNSVPTAMSHASSCRFIVPTDAVRVFMVSSKPAIARRFSSSITFVRCWSGKEKAPSFSTRVGKGNPCLAFSACTYWKGELHIWPRRELIS
mmetsp:Transcript_49249/g.130442  ORF Transcript_49249/g.130442 Transcript_49249/m.130442 type:complete len:201 (-) Transcript_49249:373-975(-)